MFHKDLVHFCCAPQAGSHGGADGTAACCWNSMEDADELFEEDENILEMRLQTPVAIYAIALPMAAIMARAALAIFSKKE